MLVRDLLRSKELGRVVEKLLYSVAGIGDYTEMIQNYGIVGEGDEAQWAGSMLVGAMRRVADADAWNRLILAMTLDDELCERHYKLAEVTLDQRREEVREAESDLVTMSKARKEVVKLRKAGKTDDEIWKVLVKEFGSS
jgi:hypothetical protein